MLNICRLRDICLFYNVPITYQTHNILIKNIFKMVNKNSALVANILTNEISFFMLIQWNCFIKNINLCFSLEF